MTAIRLLCQLARARCLPILVPVALAAPASAQSIESAKQLFERAKYAEAKAEFAALAKADARVAAVPYYLGRITAIENHGDDAVRLFERAVELEEGNALYHFWLGSALRDSAPRASKLKMPGIARRMKREFERAVELDPAQLDARASLVMFYAMAPGIMGGGVDKARAQAADLAKRDPLRGALARGIIAQAEKNAAAEVTAYRQAITAAPDTVAGYLALWDAYTRVGNTAGAFATLDEYLKRHPYDRWGMYHTGRLAGSTGQQLDRGEAALDQFLAAPPGNAYAPARARAHYWLGQIAEKRGEMDLARARYRTALKTDPNAQAAKRALEALK